MKRLIFAVVLSGCGPGLSEKDLAQCVLDGRKLIEDGGAVECGGRAVYVGGGCEESERDPRKADCLLSYECAGVPMVRQQTCWVLR